MDKILLVLSFIFIFTGTAFAEIKSQVIEYKDGNAVLEGYSVYDDAFDRKRPAVMVVHAWKGLGDYERTRADELAKLGYVAFAVDIYGKGIRPVTNEEASAQAAIYRGNRAFMRKRALAGLEELKKNELVDVENIAAIGYCFGGGVVLELARSGAEIKGVVSFHGNLDTPDPEDAKEIKAKVLVLHGEDDSFVSTEQIESFKQEMDTAKVDWRMVSYPNAVHSFTDPDSGDDPSKGVAYNRTADLLSWDEMKTFFDQIFSGKISIARAF